MGASTVPGAAKSNAETRDGHDGQARTEVKRRSLWGIVWRVGIAIVTILGAGASGATIYSAFGPLWPTQPDIEALSTPADTPLEAQFEITNKSALFSVTDVVVSCLIQRLTDTNGVDMAGFPLVQNGIPSTLVPYQRRIVLCGEVKLLGKFTDGGDILMTVSYKNAFSQHRQFTVPFHLAVESGKYYWFKDDPIL